MQGALDWHPAPKPVLEAAIEARQAAASHGVDIGTLAIKEAVRPQGIAVNLVGMRTPEEARSPLLHLSACLSLCPQQPHGALQPLGSCTLGPDKIVACLSICRQQSVQARSCSRRHVLT